MKKIQFKLPNFFRRIDEVERRQKIVELSANCNFCSAERLVLGPDRCEKCPVGKELSKLYEKEYNR